MIQTPPPSSPQLQIHARCTSSTFLRVGLDGLLGTLGVPVISADCRSLVRRRPPTLYRFFFDAGVPRSHRTLPPTLCLSSSLFRRLAFSSSHLFLSDPTIRVCLPRTAITQSPRSYTHLADHTVITPLGLCFSPSSIPYGTYPENPTRLIFSHAQVLQYLSFPPQPYLFTPDPKSEQRGSAKETFLSPLFGCLPRGSFVAWPHRSCLRSLRYASLRRE